MTSFFHISVGCCMSWLDIKRHFKSLPYQSKRKPANHEQFFWRGSPSYFNVGRLHELIVGPPWNPTFKGAQTANKSLTHIVEYSKLMMIAFCPKLIVECSYIILSFKYSSSNNFRLAVEFTLILHSERQCNASIIVRFKVALPEPHNFIVILMLKQTAPNHSHQLIVRCICSKISLHFCEDFRIFCEGVKDNGSIVIKQWSANNPDANKMWRHSSRSNNERLVSHWVNVANKHGINCEGNNSLQRPILPLILTSEAEMQMAVNVFKLAGLKNVSETRAWTRKLWALDLSI